MIKLFEFILFCLAFVGVIVLAFTTTVMIGATVWWSFIRMKRLVTSLLP